MKTRSSKIVFLIIVVFLVSAVGYYSTNHEINKSVGLNLRDSGMTLIIDAGHGGADGGAVSISGVKESELNLDIALKVEQIAAFYGIHTVMTRTAETLDYSEKSNSIREKKSEDQNNRLELINGTKKAVLISIHENIYPSAGPFGAQVLYAPTNGSKVFAEYLQDSLIRSLNTRNRRSAAQVPSSILLLNHIKCPAIIVECGFLSNTEEERLLKTETYRLKLAAVITAGYLKQQGLLQQVISGGFNEG